ncbi:Golgi transport complex subunit 4 [Chytridiales sp. JEL 0842]|nr:Golgi transport complex subunit 4 [Chytridiales sp. JEL 0842]
MMMAHEPRHPPPIVVNGGRKSHQDTQEVNVDSNSATKYSELDETSDPSILSPMGDLLIPPQPSLPIDELKKLVDISEIQKQLRYLNQEEANLDAELDTLLKNQSELETRLDTLQTLAPQIALLGSEAEVLSKVTCNASVIAERISDKVRQLDLEQDCANGVKQALKSEDYESGARHINRFLKFDQDVLSRIFQNPNAVLAFANSSSTTTSPIAGIPSDLDMSDPLTVSLINAGIDPSNLGAGGLGAISPLETLRAAHKELVDIITDQFDRAIKSMDEAGIVRFFKLFPLVGRSSVGLDRYARFICGIVARYCQDAMRGSDDRYATVFADLLTRLFETIANLLDKQETLVDSTYGPGRLLRILHTMQKEADVQSSIILDSFSDRRQVARKVADMATLQAAAAQNKPAPSTIQMEAKDVDPVLTEIALIAQRTYLFQRFLTVRSESELEKLTFLENPKNQEDIPELAGIEINKNSRLVLRVRELLADFAALDEFFITKSIEKAMKIDEYEAGNQTSSSVDDVFYIFKTSISRVLSTSDSSSICTLLGSVGRILETEFMNVFKKRLTTAFSSTETKDNKVAYMVLLNNMDVSCDYMQKLVKEVDADISQLFAGSPAKDVEGMKVALGTVVDYSNSFKKTLMTWVENVFNQTIKPRLRPLMQDCYKDIRYILTEDEYNEQDVQDLVAKRFINSFGKLIAPYKKIFTVRNYNQTMSYVVDTICKEWERVLLQNQKFNQLGALRFDKDLRSISSYLSSMTQWTLRDKFVRLSQISSVLNLETLAEIHETWGAKSGPMTWRLTASEVRKFAGLRTDFKPEDIAKLKL